MKAVVRKKVERKRTFATRRVRSADRSPPRTHSSGRAKQRVIDFSIEKISTDSRVRARFPKVLAVRLKRIRLVRLAHLQVARSDQSFEERNLSCCRESERKEDDRGRAAHR